jgi:Protein of unknown function (DUF1822)
MVSDLTNSPNFQALPQLGDWVDLDAAAMAQAATLSQSVRDPECRWQSYLALLALEGFEAWFIRRVTPIRWDRRPARLVEPTGFDLPAAITDLRLNQFRLCLIPVSSILDGEVEIPAAVVHRPTAMGHFYVTVAVNPEAGAAQVRGFLRYDQLIQAIGPLSLTDSQTYCLPDRGFNSNLEHLLLFTNSLDPSAIALPVVASANPVRALTELLAQPVFKVSDWLERQVTAAAGGVTQVWDDIAWTLVPPTSATSGGLRSMGELSPIRPSRLYENGRIRDLDSASLGIPEAAVAVHQELRVGARALRLSIVMWELPAADTAPEWSLLAILEPLPEDVAEGGDVRLLIADEEQVLVESVLGAGADCEVAQGIGFLDEPLTVTLQFASGDVLRLPPFRF